MRQGHSKVRLQDVARLAGVSVSAVSRCFTPGASVSDQTRLLVLKAARELGYPPAFSGKGQPVPCARIIAIASPGIVNAWYAERVDHLSKALNRVGFQTLLIQADGLEEGTLSPDHALLQVMDCPLDGMLVLNDRLSDSALNVFKRMRWPVILVTGADDRARFSAVGVDNEEGGRLAAHSLVQAGCKRIAYIAGSEKAPNQIERERGFRQALAELGVNLFSRAAGHGTESGTQHATRVLFARAPRPDGLMVPSDWMAMLVMDTLRSEMNIRIPQDVSVIGFDHVAPAGWPAYGLTTIGVSVEQWVREAIDLLMQQMREHDAPIRQVRLPVKLIARTSLRQSA